MPKISNSEAVKAAQQDSAEVETGFYMIMRTIARNGMVTEPGSVTPQYFVEYVNKWMEDGWKVQNTAVVPPQGALSTNLIEIVVFLVKQ